MEEYSNFIFYDIKYDIIYMKLHWYMYRYIGIDSMHLCTCTKKTIEPICRIHPQDNSLHVNLRGAQ